MHDGASGFLGQCHGGLLGGHEADRRLVDGSCPRQPSVPIRTCHIRPRSALSAHCACGRPPRSRPAGMRIEQGTACRRCGGVEGQVRDLRRRAAWTGRHLRRADPRRLQSGQECSCTAMALDNLLETGGKVHLAGAEHRPRVTKVVYYTASACSPRCCSSSRSMSSSICGTGSCTTDQGPFAASSIDVARGRSVPLDGVRHRLRRSAHMVDLDAYRLSFLYEPFRFGIMNWVRFWWFPAILRSG